MKYMACLKSLINQHIGSTYQFPKRVIFADGNLVFSAAGTFPEKAGSTEAQNQKWDHFKPKLGGVTEFKL